MLRSLATVAIGIGFVTVAACTSGTTAPPGTTNNGNPASSSLVTQCQSLANNFATLCAGDDVRPCLWSAYAKLCVTGQTQLLVDSMGCLDQTTCRTFSDPNEGESCLQTLHAKEESAGAKSFYQFACTTCGESDCSTVPGTDEIFPYLTDSDLTAMQTCAGSAVCNATSSALTACESVVGFAPFIACFGTD